mmetsp:Transcript_170479/g.546729  ORF Transcript_170479/g.546729 Transcript_170479/m.546729 type:complete len:398 (-) Transcript_170479:6898-8091(-)
MQGGWPDQRPRRPGPPRALLAARHGAAALCAVLEARETRLSRCRGRGAFRLVIRLGGLAGRAAAACLRRGRELATRGRRRGGPRLRRRRRRLPARHPGPLGRGRAPGGAAEDILARPDVCLGIDPLGSRVRAAALRKRGPLVALGGYLQSTRDVRRIALVPSFGRHAWRLLGSRTLLVLRRPGPHSVAGRCAAFRWTGGRVAGEADGGAGSCSGVRSGRLGLAAPPARRARRGCIRRSAPGSGRAALRARAGPLSAAGLDAGWQLLVRVRPLCGGSCDSAGLRSPRPRQRSPCRGAGSFPVGGWGPVAAGPADDGGEATDGSERARAGVGDGLGHVAGTPRVLAQDPASKLRLLVKVASGGCCRSCFAVLLEVISACDAGLRRAVCGILGNKVSVLL